MRPVRTNGRGPASQGMNQKEVRGGAPAKVCAWKRGKRLAGQGSASFQQTIPPLGASLPLRLVRCLGHPGPFCPFSLLAGTLCFSCGPEGKRTVEKARTDVGQALLLVDPILSVTPGWRRHQSLGSLPTPSQAGGDPYPLQYNTMQTLQYRNNVSSRMAKQNTCIFDAG